MQPDVYTTRDIAAAARVPDSLVAALIARGEIRSVGTVLPARVISTPVAARFVVHDEAVRAVRALCEGAMVALPDTAGACGRELFAQAPLAGRSTAVPLAVSTSLHGLAAVSVMLIVSLGYGAPDQRADMIETAAPVRMVFLAAPGPGGGGGGGGLRQRTPPPAARRKGTQPLSSPIPARRLPPPVRPTPPPAQPPPPLIEATSLPPVMAPVATAPADPQVRAGVEAQVASQVPSRGPGTGAGTGSGAGTSLGEGDGAGIGDGTGGGTGGGPYRPGSGVEPPRLLREVRAHYSDTARRANVEGEVVMEIVVRRDGLVGDVRVLRGLGSDLNTRAIDAVRLWRFAPARLKGNAVDVIVEVSVEFKLR